MIIKLIISLVLFFGGIYIAWKGADKNKLWPILAGAIIAIIGVLGIITYAP